MEKIIKRVNRVYHEGRQSDSPFRVRYNQKDFDILAISFTVQDKKRYFVIPVNDLPDKDSIYFKYNPRTEGIFWSPENIINKIKEVNFI